MGDIGPGETVGEMAFITGDPRSASVVAARDSGLLKMTADQFSDLVHHFPGAVLPIVRAILKRQQRLRGASAAFCPSTIAIIPTSGSLPLKSFQAQLVVALGRVRKVHSTGRK